MKLLLCVGLLTLVGFSSAKSPDKDEKPKRSLIAGNNGLSTVDLNSRSGVDILLSEGTYLGSTTSFENSASSHGDSFGNSASLLTNGFNSYNNIASRISYDRSSSFTNTGDGISVSAGSQPFGSSVSLGNDAIITGLSTSGPISNIRTHEVRTITQHVPIPVPQPYPVTVTKQVLVPQPYPVHITKQVPVPVHIRVPVVVPKPFPVKVPHPVPVPVHVKVPVEVPRPYPVTITKTIAVPVEKPVYIRVPHPVAVPVNQPYPVPVPHAVPVKVPHPVVVKVPEIVAINNVGYNSEFGSSYNSGINSASVHNSASSGVDSEANSFIDSNISSEIRSAIGSEIDSGAGNEVQNPSNISSDVASIHTSIVKSSNNQDNLVKSNVKNNQGGLSEHDVSISE